MKFGTSGLRGLAEALDGPAAVRYTRAFIAHLRATGRMGDADAVLVGRDLRESSPSIKTRVFAGVAEEGLRPLDCGALPTPALAHFAMETRRPAIMVTGSHVPADRNGLKFYWPGGEIDKDDEAGILAALESVGGEIGETDSAESTPEAGTRFIARCMAILPRGALAGLRIGVFQHSSVARDGLVNILTDYGAEVQQLGRATSFRALDTEAIDAEDETLARAWVSGMGLDALVSTDGDADRPMMVDETGAMLRGDVIGVLVARALRADHVVTPVTSNSAIEATRFFPRVIRTRVGSPYVIAGMEEAARAGGRIIVGFEANGGVLLGSDVRPAGSLVKALPTRDAMLPILVLLGEIASRRQTLSALVAEMPSRQARSDRLEDVPAERSAALLSELAGPEAAARFFTEVGRIASVSDIDGMRFGFEGGEIIHFRASGNAPELRCYTEAENGARAGALLYWALAAARRAVRG
ncbi:phosphomannomutase [Arsenicitalea aurantiaca]|uniref:Phosphomannomutase n=1 Tax=Arsenicitalea aurantiaca TaxID=1783274 RepID=A0A433XMB2_9HYPH|nr:phosphomannomutase [Arsenicitalea aurantiaca]